MITIKQGEDYTKILSLQYADTQSAVDLTGVTAYSQMREKPETAVVAEAVCEVDASAGIIRVNYSSDELSSVPKGEYGYDVWIKENSKKHPIYTTRVKIVGSYTDIN